MGEDIMSFVGFGFLFIHSEIRAGLLWVIAKGVVIVKHNHLPSTVKILIIILLFKLEICSVAELTTATPSPYFPLKAQILEHKVLVFQHHIYHRLSPLLSHIHFFFLVLLQSQ